LKVSSLKKSKYGGLKHPNNRSFEGIVIEPTTWSAAAAPLLPGLQALVVKAAKVPISNDEDAVFSRQR